MAIEWPKEWGDGIEEDWPTVHGGLPRLKGESRTWSAFAQALWQQGVRFAHLVESLGGPVAMRNNRTMEEAKAAVNAYFRQHGKRPAKETHSNWRNWDAWLCRRGSSLSQLCDELELPALVCLDRSIKEAKTSVLAYYEEHATRPTPKTSPEWENLNAWLRRQGSSLSKLCDDLGLPSLLCLSRTFEGVKAAVLAYYERHGKRPLAELNPEWARWNSWLRYNRGFSLRQLCDDLGLPGGLRLDRTIESAKAEVLAYYEEHGTRPTNNEGSEWGNWDAWLRKQEGSSLSQLCDKLGLPGRSRLDRTIGEGRAVLLAHFKKNKERPTKRTSPEWSQWDQWLRAHGSSLSRLCDELGLPARWKRAA